MTPPPPPPIRVHGLADARAALAAAAELGVAVRLVSAPAAGAHAGAAWFRALVEQARAEFPHVATTAVLDCGDARGAALAAIRAGVTDIALDAPPDVLAKVAAIAAAAGARLHPREPEGFDLRACGDPAEVCRRWLKEYPQ